MNKNYIFLFAFLILNGLHIQAATVDSLDIPSAAMNKTYKAAVVLPASYTNNKANYPVLYLLHGGSGHFRDWLTSTPDKMLVKNLADQFNLIVVMPEGEVSGWYINSPLDKDNQFETYITQEVVNKIDNTYRTIRDRKGRVVTGLSMGGHGALYLSAKHPDLYCAAGSMSGALDLNINTWKINPAFASRIKQNFQRLIGDTTNTALYTSYSVVGLADQMKKNDLRLIIDCGVDDFLIEANRELHHRLLYNQTPHDYIERPGGHSWPYWQNSLPYHVWYFFQILKTNGSAVVQ